MWAAGAKAQCRQRGDASPGSRGATHATADDLLQPPPCLAMARWDKGSSVGVCGLSLAFQVSFAGRRSRRSTLNSQPYAISTLAASMSAGRSNEAAVMIETCTAEGTPLPVLSQATRAKPSERQRDVTMYTQATEAAQSRTKA